MPKYRVRVSIPFEYEINATDMDHAVYQAKRLALNEIDTLDTPSVTLENIDEIK
jgi:hypothetical protein